MRASILACQVRAARLHSALVGALPSGSVSSAALISRRARPSWRPARMNATRRSMYRGYRRWLPERPLGRDEALVS